MKVLGIDLIQNKDHRRKIQSIINTVSSELRVKSVEVDLSEIREEVYYTIRFYFECNHGYSVRFNVYNFDESRDYTMYAIKIIESVKREFLVIRGLTYR